MGQHKEEQACSLLTIICVQGLCGAAVVAGLKIVPAIGGFDIVTHPVETLEISLVRQLASHRHQLKCACQGLYTLFAEVICCEYLLNKKFSAGQF